MFFSKISKISALSILLLSVGVRGEEQASATEQDVAAAAAPASTATVPTTTTTATTTAEGGGVCPVTTKSIAENWWKFHDDSRCNRVEYDTFRRSLGKPHRHAALKQSGLHKGVPNQKTIVCPTVVNTLTQPNQVVGYDTNWIVENTASTPVVLAYMNEKGIETSALDSSISPPEHDPKAILQPGHWIHLHTYEGHIFHVRELNEDGSTGRVLLQHRVGLIPVAAKKRHLLKCPKDIKVNTTATLPPRVLAKKLDPEPVIQKDSGKKVRDPNFRRSLVPILDKVKRTEPMKNCHMLDLGFRNMADCPLHGYWQKPDSCEEEFKLHLGTSKDPNDFMWDWQSPTKFESTFIGHSFIFRSPLQPELGIIEQVSITPTQIVDCPSDMKQTVNVQVPASEQVEITDPTRVNDAPAMYQVSTGNLTLDLDLLSNATNNGGVAYKSYSSS